MIESPQTARGRAVIYLRVSTSAQAEKADAEEGFSIPAQRDACTRKAEQLGADVVDEYVDRGESARSADRPQLQAMLAALKAEGDVDFVIVHKVDRLARSREDDVKIVLAIQKAGAKLVSATENIDETPSGKLLHGIMATIAEFYSQNLANEVIKGLSQKAKMGGTPSKAPIGYKNVIDRVDGKIVRTVEVDEERAPHVKWAFEAYATGDYMIREIAEHLDDRGLRTRPSGSRGSKALHKSQVERLLSNPYYIGIVTYRGVQYPGRHEPLISMETWELVQALKTSRGLSKEKPYKHPHYLKGSLFCGNCGTRLGVTKIRKKRQGLEYDYFYCIGRQNRDNRCTQRYVPMDVIEDKVVELWQSIELQPEQLEAIEREVLAFVREQTESQAESLRIQADRLARLEDERSKLMNAYYAGAVPVDLLKQEQTRIGREMRACRKILDVATTDVVDVEAGLARLLELVRDCGWFYQQASGAVRRQMNQAAFERIVVDQDEIRGSYLRSPFKELVGPTMEEMEPPAEPGASGQTYFRPRSGLVLPEEIEASLRQVFRDAGSPTPSGLEKASETTNRPPHEETAGSNVLLMVRLRGLEPPRP